jgi:hydrogenase expression/formation protein HypC
MCIAIPSRVVEVRGEFSAVVERYGERLEVSLVMLSEPLNVGDWVALQGRAHAVQRLDPAEAEEALKLFDEVFGRTVQQ